MHETITGALQRRKTEPQEQMQKQHPQRRDPIDLHMVQEILRQSYTFVLRLKNESVYTMRITWNNCHRLKIHGTNPKIQLTL